MSDTPIEPALEAEFDCLMARAGIAVPPERRAAVLTGFVELRGQVAMLRTRRDAAAEPAQVFRLIPR